MAKIVVLEEGKPVEYVLADPLVEIKCSKMLNIHFCIYRGKIKTPVFRELLCTETVCIDPENEGPTLVVTGHYHHQNFGGRIDIHPKNSLCLSIHPMGKDTWSHTFTL